MPEIVFLPNHARYEGGSRRDQIANDAKKGWTRSWTCKKKAHEGDLYLFYFGNPDSVLTAVGVCDGNVREEENDGTWDWTDAKRGWFCGFEPLIRLDRPVPQAAMETHRVLGKWWSGKPYFGRPKMMRPAYAKALLQLIEKENPRQHKLVRLFRMYGQGLAAPPRNKRQLSHPRFPIPNMIKQRAIDKDHPPARLTMAIRRIIRDSPLAQSLKALHGHACQVCEAVIETPHTGGRPYCEVHHLRPLGGGHKGKDDWRNMVVVCPTCHAELDLLAIGIHPDSLRIATFVPSHHWKGNRLRAVKGHELGVGNLRYQWRIFQSAIK